MPAAAGDARRGLATPAAVLAVPVGMTRKIGATVALAGNPNAGKTALFNAMTGVRQKTGNWPGVTVERKLGRYCFDDEWFTLVDLPGTYSLDATSPDQLIARDAVLSGDFDVVVNALDALEPRTAPQPRRPTGGDAGADGAHAEHDGRR